jgi:WD40 repeat-containing protein SMU1
MHDQTVLCLDFSPDSDMLVSGCQDGKIKVWRVDSGKCLRKYDRAHGDAGVTSVQFSTCGGKIVSASFDGTVKIHGLKSGKTLVELRGHGTFVNCASYFGVGDKQVVSGSSDGFVKIWDAGTGEEKQSWTPPQPLSAKKTGAKAPIASVSVLQTEPVTLLVCPRNSSSVHVMSLSGDLVRSYTVQDIGADSVANFVHACVSPKGDFVYALGGDGALHCFSQTSGVREHVLRTHDPGALGVTHHARQIILATFAKGGAVSLWKP